MLALEWGGITYPWSKPLVWGLLVGFGLLIGAFLGIQVWAKDRYALLSSSPLRSRKLKIDFRASIPLQLVKQRTVAAGSLFILFINSIVGLLMYYLPLYFQSAKDSSARDSGIRNLPFLVTMLFAPMLSGSLISLIGYYVPFMWIGAILTTIGSGLLFTLRVNSSRAVLDVYQIIAGLGLGICTQIPFNAVQYILPKNQTTMGSALVSFCNSLGPILGTNVGQAIFANKFVQRLHEVPGVNAVSVVQAGPTNIAAAAGASSAVREAFNFALTRAFVWAIVSGGLALCCSLAMEWGNVKREWRQKGEEEMEESTVGQKI